jgi:hypothetical protein
MNVKKTVQVMVLAVCLLGLAAAQEEPGRVADKNDELEVIAGLSLNPGENGSINVQSRVQASVLDENKSAETNGTINLDAVGNGQRRSLLDEVLGGPVNVTGTAKFFGANITEENGTVESVEMRISIQVPGGEPIELFLSERVPPEGFGSQPA